MIEFNSDHIGANLESVYKKIKRSVIVTIGGLIVSVMLFSGCSKISSLNSSELVIGNMAIECVDDRIVDENNRIIKLANGDEVTLYKISDDYINEIQSHEDSSSELFDESEFDSKSSMEYCTIIINKNNAIIVNSKELFVNGTGNVIYLDNGDQILTNNSAIILKGKGVQKRAEKYAREILGEGANIINYSDICTNFSETENYGGTAVFLNESVFPSLDGTVICNIISSPRKAFNVHQWRIQISDGTEFETDNEVLFVIGYESHNKANSMAIILSGKEEINDYDQLVEQSMPKKKSD